MPRRARLQPPGAPQPALGRMSRRVLASWQRCEDYGVPLESVDPRFSGSIDDDSLFHRCGHQVLAEMAHGLTEEPVGLILTDDEGRVLDRLSGDHSLLRCLDDDHLAPGFCFSEREAGTNGLGLALADRTASLVRAQEHYTLSLCRYTCAAAPVLDPSSGRLLGAVNLTTWSHASSELLLALARSAASNTAALMWARTTGHEARPAPRGEVFRIEAPRLEPGAGSVADLSPGWTTARARAVTALRTGHRVLAVGEPGSGRSTLLAQAQRRHDPGTRILAASPPDPEDVDAWLSLWGPEVDKPHTAVVLRRVDEVPRGAAHRLRDLLTRPGVQAPLAFTARAFADVPAQLAALVDTVVFVPPLRERPEDVLPLVHHLAFRLRGRPIDFAPVAERVLIDHDWPGNVGELARVVREAAARTDRVELADLPVLTAEGTRRLSRIETFERDEILRVLSRGGVSMAAAAEQLGMSRATLYRKVAHYGVQRPAPSMP